MKANVANAVNAVVNPANGQIVCASTLTNPTNGCLPWNVMGIGVNSLNTAELNYLSGGGGYLYDLIQQETAAATVTGEPFSDWAGPVSLAASFEHRADIVHGISDPYSRAAGRNVGNLPSLNGSQTVTEGSLETVIPLAKNESWAQAWDFTAAARFTGYEYSGYVTTYKLGTTYTPIDDVRIRLNRSRDIRAPNLLELFAISQVNIIGGSITDPFNNNLPAPGPAYQVTSGNPNLTPEVGETNDIGVVISPRFLAGFTMSVDYWDVNIHNAIETIPAQTIVNGCYTGQQVLCGLIVRNSAGAIDHINAYPINFADQAGKGIDLEASYRVSMSSIVSNWRGDVSLHGLMTIYLRDYQNSGYSAPLDVVGQNDDSGVTGASPPHWKLNATATYSLDPISVSLTGRAFSNGVFNNSYVACTSGCPVSTTSYPTINMKFLPGRIYLDSSVEYKIASGPGMTAELFLSVKNMFNASVPPMPAVYYDGNGLLSDLYDLFGTVYRMGVRFKM